MVCNLYIFQYFAYRNHGYVAFVESLFGNLRGLQKMIPTLNCTCTSLHSSVISYDTFQMDLNG